MLPLLVPALVGICPTVTVQQRFNLTEFVTGGKWFIHQQMPIDYLPSDWFYCVTAHYAFKSDSVLHVSNYANKGKVNGVVEDSDKNVPFGGICGDVQNASTPAKLSVGPCGLPGWVPGARGPYWVLAAGPNPDRYEWALVSGGQPTIETPDGCRTGKGVNHSGLWIFLRSMMRDEATINMLRNVAASKGFDLSVLGNVTHAGCNYAPGSDGAASERR